LQNLQKRQILIASASFERHSPTFFNKLLKPAPSAVPTYSGNCSPGVFAE